MQHSLCDALLSSQLSAVRTDSRLPNALQPQKGIEERQEKLTMPAKRPGTPFSLIMLDRTFRTLSLPPHCSAVFVTSSGMVAVAAAAPLMPPSSRCCQV